MKCPNCERVFEESQGFHGFCTPICEWTHPHQRVEWTEAGRVLHPRKEVISEAVELSSKTSTDIDLESGFVSCLVCDAIVDTTDRKVRYCSDNCRSLNSKFKAEIWAFRGKNYAGMALWEVPKGLKAKATNELRGKVARPKQKQLLAAYEIAKNLELI